MDKREFLKTSGAFLAGSMLSPLASGGQTAGRTNWSGNYTYSTDRLHQPKTVEEVQQVVKSCSKLRALGARLAIAPSSASVGRRLRSRRGRTG